ncbi:MAG: DUF3007 family protein [Cyanobacteria bacterium REEB459]|nr:DUF3007 family protein [Cyanobacteria bacterium REEB459]
MRRIDVLIVGLAIFLAGAVAFGGLRGLGLDNIQAGIWTQALMVAGLVGWLATYLLRVVGRKMTLNQQMTDYESAVLQKRLEELTQEQLQTLQARLEAEGSSSDG